VLAASLVLILAVTLAPTDGRGVVEVSDLDDIVDALARAEVRPTLGIVAEWAANVLLFLPFGAALALHGFSTTKTVLSGLLVSTVVEGAQLLFVDGRTTSLDDVVLNTVGAVLGHLLVSRLRNTRTP
jgi:glycopeptide antibiotics resistance protein